MTRILYFDCFSGISGDLTIGALCDLEVVVQVAPEFESCCAAAERIGQPLPLVYQAALASYPPPNEDFPGAR